MFDAIAIAKAVVFDKIRSQIPCKTINPLRNLIGFAGQIRRLKRLMLRLHSTSSGNLIIPSLRSLTNSPIYSHSN